MITLYAYATARLHGLRERIRQLPDDGYSTETILVTALLVALALGAVAIIAAKVYAKINATNL
ncbi:hypothetical protein [Catellatospora chokoriensis]|uniref:Uncharacterized protein n=1 Tax=Catellatospora chokoriensis TaxID=310353 RepID=A0A8J3NR30_9ACTN|nr:hypothetical protein [Catellatospora chokoriensis]GIF89787.1 hypothetical protein Cch02nite_32310 [Catellatospora chokoriensis]